ncbi:inositol-3-phosphate synthase [Agromyces sp. SYSU K20354]|uniref:inositol-3-phosphate synthase n=1 Tax=Agromyces cavernae TaxID=2898659 RepID=UPI001E38D022|nr:inositol-3-phosphate synthase [Agromyces cavernae]MCD2441330.1 inositol-3-phosphate synthase [Agromyces cavernae]
MNDDTWRNDVTMLDTPPTEAQAPSRPSDDRVGIWLVGARGSIGTTVAVGLHVIANELAAPTGCTTAGDEFVGVPLPRFADLVLGGHDISSTPLSTRAHQLAEAGMIPPRLVSAARAGLEQAEAEIRPGYDPAGHHGPQAEAVRRLAADISGFRERHGLRTVVVVDVTSTEPLPDDRPEFHDRDLLAAVLADADGAPLPASAITALAAIESGSAYACFTPSAGLTLPAIHALADERGIAFAGQDGKTGETLLRTAIAPMFVARGMHVHSWAGANLLGGGDGATLADPEAVRSKLASKTRGLRSLVGEHVVAPLHIDNVPDLGDIKTAWDHIHAEGFLGSRITMQTIWSAYDSMLAAPLILDIARLLALAEEAGVRGVVPELGFFFKDPWGSDVHDFSKQAAELYAWAHATGEGVAAATAARRSEALGR